MHSLLLDCRFSVSGLVSCPSILTWVTFPLLTVSLPARTEPRKKDNFIGQWPQNLSLGEYLLEGSIHLPSYGLGKPEMRPSHHRLDHDRLTAICPFLPSFLSLPASHAMLWSFLIAGMSLTHALLVDTLPCSPRSAAARHVLSTTGPALTRSSSCPVVMSSSPHCCPHPWARCLESSLYNGLFVC